MRIHLYEFRAANKKLTCACGWQRTLKTADSKTVHKTFSEHCRDAKPEA